MILSIIALAAAQSPAIKSDPLLTDLERRAVRFFWEQSNPNNGFSKDRATNADGVDKHEVASCASVGFALVAYTIGVEHKWLDRKEALARTRVTLQGILKKWPHERGWLYHFIDWKTGKRVWNCEASTIDTSICLAGVLAAQQYWKDPEVTRDANAFAKRIDWRWAVTNNGEKPELGTVVHGWRPEEGFLKGRWENFDENKMLYIQAYGLSSVNTSGWDKIVRETVKYRGLDMIRGGPLFMHQMSESFYDFKDMRDRGGYDYWVESRNAALGNRAYCIENPKGFKAYGPNFWGLSACDVPNGYDAMGAPGWINDNGTITPTSAVATLPFIPEHALTFAHTMRKEHPQAWGKYGFPNGYNPTEKWVGPDVIGIDLGMMMCAIENARTGFVQKLSASHPAVKLGYERTGLRKVAGSSKGPMIRF